MPSWIKSVPVWTSIIFIYLFTCVCFLLLFGVLLYFDKVSLCSCSWPEAHREPPAFCLLIAGIKGCTSLLDWLLLPFYSLLFPFLFLPSISLSFELPFHILYLLCNTNLYLLLKKLNCIYIYWFVCVCGGGIREQLISVSLLPP